ncbi:alpha/beta-hydrolase [Guyanagaster necrorhizus]|uniref:Dipeptidyl-peptidase V n=1 Tax=Guyanagaster necrorhizus TaxID=856835 RepID=A0A9P8APH0_9AGAR|nr:alpha/beta-hydrolase [Guyanagaster necrorhizus MCA 3950]KAG7442969.1 alpha/beta-hydrolase [Guyanagaster necrorhizus MCA 3950]
MRLPYYFIFLPIVLAVQVPFKAPLSSPVTTMNAPSTFAFKEGPDVFSPKDLVELGRPGTGVANPAGDLVLVPYNKYSSKDKKVNRSIFVAPLAGSGRPFEIPVSLLFKGGEAFWLDGRTVAHVVEGDKKLDIYALDIDYKKQDSDEVGTVSAPNLPTLLGSFPTTTATNFRYSLLSGQLVFSDNVYPDGNLSAVKEQDEAWENRGTTALVYDTTYERHWDTWTGPKTTSLFSVRLVQDPDHKWHFGSQFTNILKGTGHSCPVEPFGGTDDFDISTSQVVYTAKDPDLPPAWHTKQNVYIIDILGGKPRELTSGKQGATHNPVFNKDGSKVAWLELDLDGYESDRAKIVIYDLKKDVRYTLTQQWDRSPDSLAFSKTGEFIYFTAGDNARVKVFVLPLPPTPSKSTTDPDLDTKYVSPVAITDGPAAGGLQSLYYGRLLITQSSYTSPNDVFLVSGLKDLESEIGRSDTLITFSGEIKQITRFTENDLKGKNLSKGESIWFKGAEDKNIQGWILKPKGWKEGETKKWPVVLLIHGGPQSAWEDQWSTRWNPNIFAQQGYFSVLINPTGSTTFGQEFTDGITEDWGGKPFVDLQKGWKYVLNTYPEIDPDRAVAAGASWGGYAVNWIQGHPEYEFNFKALVCHDGVFDSNYNGFSTDELFFFNHDWAGRPWEKKSKEIIDKYNPSNFVHKWGTPQLLIHGSKDYRLAETESIGAFHALQQRGVPSRLVIFPDENHWVLNHGNSLKWHYEVFRWFDQFVGEKST